MHKFFHDGKVLLRIFDGLYGHPGKEKYHLACELEPGELRGLEHLIDDCSRVSEVTQVDSDYAYVEYWRQKTEDVLAQKNLSTQLIGKTAYSIVLPQSRPVADEFKEMNTRIFGRGAALYNSSQSVRDLFHENWDDLQKTVDFDLRDLRCWSEKQYAGSELYEGLQKSMSSNHV